jgi:hypothetical protein
MNAPRSGCPINLTLEALGDRWSLIVIRDLMFSNRRHFRELLTRSEERIASNILADRLTRLEKAGLVSRRDDPCLDNRILLMRQTKTDRSISDTSLLFPTLCAPTSTEDHSPPVGFWEAEGPFVTSNAGVFTFMATGKGRLS